MTLKEFITQLKADYNLQKTVDQIEAIVTRHAREEAKGNVAVIDDDTVKDWIINSDAEQIIEKPAPAAEVKAMTAKTSKVAQKLYEKYVEKKPEPPKAEPKEKKEYEQTSLFDLL